MSKLRPVAKRLDLNEYEAMLLKIKSKQCGLSESAYIRELITGHSPKQAPGKEFYEAMNNINRIGININQIAITANSTGVIDAEYLKSAVDMLSDKMLEIKQIVLSAEPYHASYYEKLIYEKKRAKSEGRPVPKFGDDLFPEE